MRESQHPWVGRAACRVYAFILSDFDEWELGAGSLFYRSVQISGHDVVEFDAVDFAE
jgi:hypothetical protein